MDEQVARQALAALRVLADLAPAGESRQQAGSVPLEWFRWLPLTALALVARPEIDDPNMYSPFVDRAFAERLAAVDRLRPEQRSLRVGWLFLAGTVETPDGPRAIFQPLVTVPVRVSSGFFDGRLVPAGDAELSPLVTDPEVRQRLESDIQVGGGSLLSDADPVVAPPGLLAIMPKLNHFARTAAAAAGVPVRRVVPGGGAPSEYTRGEPVVVAGVAVYAVHEAGAFGRAATLRAWREDQLRTWTAFHSVYVDAPVPPAGGVTAQDGDEVLSPFPLTPAQRSALLSARSEPVTVVSGPPGTGKSHTVVAIACDATARGESVLVAARSDATVDALLGLLERSPGARPVVFGSAQRRVALASRLASGALAPDGDVGGTRDRLRTAVARRDALRDDVERLLRAETLCHEASAAELAEARAIAPGFLEPATPLDDVPALLAAAGAGGWRGWWRARRARRSLDRLSGAAGVAAGELRRAYDIAVAARVALDLRAGGGLDLSGRWPALLAAEEEVRQRIAGWLAADARSPARLSRSTLPVVAALATALRSGRAARREQLRSLDPGRLTRALPLWVGALPDVDDLLPAVPAMFDLVVIDEASSVDQPLAASALLRGRRAVVVGDPRQLRHVSFVADAGQREAATRHDVPPLVAPRLDVRRNSAFDVAAAVAPARMLDEHFRCDPHLVAYVFDRLYDRQVHIATRTPLTEASDRIEAVRVDGVRAKTGVVPREVEQVMALLRARRDRAGDNATTIGLLTPFRAQADALEAAVLREFDADAIGRLGLRVGTVHAFQGNERDVIIASLALDGASSPASWRFAEDAHLLAVMLTRARHEFVLVHSAEPPPGSVLEGYLRQANDPPSRAPGAPPADAWTAAIAADLAAAGRAVRTHYPAGRHRVDICVDASRPFAVACHPHPDGPRAHVERHEALVRAGWTVREAFRSRWEHRRGELVVGLLRELG